MSVTEAIISPSPLPTPSPRTHIIIKGARTHNLKNVDVAIPRNQLVVITGVSGSGKSSLTINTLYAEGQRRYVESLSAYARQFLMRMNKPDVDYIKGICPALAIEQKVSTRTTRSTVGSLTEIYDYLRLLYARIGKTISPVSGEEVKKHDVQDVLNYLQTLKEDTRVLILAELKKRKDVTLKKELELLIQKGFTRIHSNGETHKIEDILNANTKSRGSDKKKSSSDSLSFGEGRGEADTIEILIDRIAVKHDDEELTHRIADSVSTAFFEGHGECVLELADDNKKRKSFSNKFELDGITFEQPTPHFFNFNNSLGACPVCEGFGTVIGVDEDLVVPDKNLSVYEGAIACWKGEKMNEWLVPLVKNALKFDFPIHRSFMHLTKEEKELLWTGNKYFSGLNDFFKYLESKSYKIQYRVMLSRYRGRTKCPDCGGSRLRKDAAYVKVGGKSISELLLMQVNEIHDFFKQLKLTAHETQIAKRLLVEVNHRLALMEEVGLEYLTLIRLSSTLSGGETQRINLTSSLGSNLTDSMYILDEPSVGLHPRDTQRLLKVLKSLRDLGNTVVVVEHEEEIIRAADYLIDMGPLAGTNGGEVIFQGTLAEAAKSHNSLTNAYLSGKMKIETPAKRRKGAGFIELIGASQHNLKDVSIKIPLNTLTAVSGVSGSGKTTLIKQILYPALNLLYGGFGTKPGAYKELKGDLRALTHIEIVDQNPIGKSSRSNPVTYVKAYDAIRDLFASQQSAKLKGYQPRHFSFNVEGGRCEACKGEGEVIVEMQFLADVHLECEECKGKRFKDEVLEVTYRSKNIFEVLEMTIDDALDFFNDEKNICQSIQPLADVGLGYVKLGQSSSSLSGGEAQRVKLAFFLSKGSTVGRTLFIFDEPTTGLHFHDIKKLLKSFNALIDKGHTIIVIEHNVEILKNADWLIDLGPEGGDAGGRLLYQGVTEGIVGVEESYTGKYLKSKV